MLQRRAVTDSRAHAAAFVALLLLATPGAAQEGPADRLLREQREAGRERMLEQQPDRIANDAAPAEPDYAGDPASLAEPGAVLLVREIRVAGNSVLPETRLSEVLRPFNGIELGAKRIALLLARLTRAYSDAGYFTTRAYVGGQDLSGGVLTVTVIEGRVERVELLDASGETLSEGAEPLRAGAILEMADLEQAVEQINRARANEAKARVLPGSKPGTSVVRIVRRRGETLRASAGLDNQGQAATGRSRVSAVLEKDALFGLADTLTVNGLRTANSWALSGAWSAPDGYNTWSYSAAVSGVDTLAAGVNSRTRSATQAVSVNRLLARDAASKTVAEASLALRREKRSLAGAELTPQDSAILRLGVDHAWRLQGGAHGQLGRGAGT